MDEKKNIIIFKIPRFCESNNESSEDDDDRIQKLFSCIKALIKERPFNTEYENLRTRFNSFNNSSINTLQRKIELANSGLFCQKKHELFREHYICFYCNACFYNLDDNLAEAHSKWFPKCYFNNNFYDSNDSQIIQPSLSLYDEYLLDISDKDANFIISHIKLSPMYLRQLTEFFRESYPLEYNGELIDTDFSLCIQNTELFGNFIAISTDADGNCLYKAISLLIYGNQDCYIQIKLSVLFILIEYEEYFRNILKVTSPEYSFEKLIEDVSQTNSWGNEYTQLAISIVFNRPLNIYLFDKNNQPIYIHQFCVNNLQLEKEKSINLAHKIHHFVALLPIVEKFISTQPKTNQFIENFKLENLITYKK